MLHYRLYGDPDGHRPPLVFLHGLFGASSNWGQVAKQLAADFFCVVPDLRNHGASFHSDDISYDAQTKDVLTLLEHLHLQQVCLIGHSMGGKVAMLTALAYPERVAKLVVVDIAPKAYQLALTDIVTALQAIPLQRLGRRADADVLLAEQIPSARVRAFLLQNLLREEGQWRWRINLPALAGKMAKISDFPAKAGSIYPGPSLFVHGADSPYLDSAGQTAIAQYFPQARIVSIANAGHWVYADQLEAFLQALQDFLLA